MTFLSHSSGPHIHWYCFLWALPLVSTFPADGTFIPVGVGVGMLLLLVMSLVLVIVVVVAVMKKAARNQKRKRKIKGNLHYNNTVAVKREMEVKK